MFGLPRLLLNPIFKLTNHNPTPKFRARFSTTDLLSLMFLIQLPFALVNLIPDRVGRLPTAATGLMLFLSAIVWLVGLRAANHIGIASQLKRAVVVGFTFPAAVCSGPWSIAISQAMFWAESGWTTALWPATWIVTVLVIHRSAVWADRGSGMYREQHKT